jgi:hypothetical protein
MQDLNDLYYFARVVEHGGFAAAGRALGIPRSECCSLTNDMANEPFESEFWRATSKAVAAWLPSR